jgi:hypothetical protein
LLRENPEARATYTALREHGHSDTQAREELARALVGCVYEAWERNAGPMGRCAARCARAARPRSCPLTRFTRATRPAHHHRSAEITADAPSRPAGSEPCLRNRESVRTNPAPRVAGAGHRGADPRWTDDSAVVRARCWSSSSGRPCAADSTRASNRSRPTLMPGCATTTTSVRTSATATRGRRPLGHGGALRQPITRNPRRIRRHLSGAHVGNRG